MARKKNKKKIVYRRPKRSIGAIGAEAATEILATTAGAVTAGKLITMLSGKMDGKIASAIPLVVGVVLPKFVKNPMVKGVAQGMIAVGGMKLVTNFLPALGASDDVVLVSGIDEIGALDQIGADIAEVNGMDINEVNGYDEY